MRISGSVAAYSRHRAVTYIRLDPGRAGYAKAELPGRDWRVDCFMQFQEKPRVRPEIALIQLQNARELIATAIQMIEGPADADVAAACAELVSVVSAIDEARVDCDLNFDNAASCL